jgi:hypothetical protein
MSPTRSIANGEYEKVTSMASSEILLRAASSSFLSWYGPRFDLFAIVCIVLLARFRGRVEALIAASAYSLVAIGFYCDQPSFFARL